MHSQLHWPVDALHNATRAGGLVGSLCKDNCTCCRKAINRNNEKKSVNFFKTSLAIALTVTFACAANADDDMGLSKQFSACMDKSGGVTVDMRDCMAKEIKKQDDRLNKSYRATGSSLSPARKKALQEAQRAWLKFRDLNCAFYNDPDGGTVAQVATDDCFMSATARRATEIEAFKQ